MIIQIDTSDARDMRALDIVASGKWLATTARGVFSMPSSTDTVSYRVTADTCSCQDTERGNVCKHRRAAKLITAHLLASGKNTARR